MGQEIDLVRRFEAEEAYITGSMSLEQLAASTGISVRQLERWSADEGWSEKRAEYRKKFADIKLSTVRLRRKIIKNALVTLNPMDVFAVGTLEKLALAAEKKASTQTLPPAAEADERGDLPYPQEIKTAAEAVEALKSVVETRLQRMLMQPDSIDLKAVKDVKQSLDLIEKMQRQAAPEAEADPTEKLLSEQAIRDIREQLKL